MGLKLRTKEFAILIDLAQSGALEKALEATTTSISQKNNISQQSASRALIKLEEESLINRTKAGRIKITAKGKDRLEDIHRDLIMALRAEENIALTGKVVSGMGEGQYYMGLEGYRKQFVAKLGYEPCQGTLNLKLESLQAIEDKQILEKSEGIIIAGFEAETEAGGTRKLGAIKCYPCQISNKGGKQVKGAVIIPERSHYGSEMLEIISPHRLKDKLELSDGDEVQVHCEL